MIADFWENNNLIDYVLKMTVVAVVLCCLLGVMSERAEAAMTDLRIETVRAEVTGDVHIPDGVCRRMEKSVETIAGQLLEGQPASAVFARKGYYEAIIQQVFDKVLVGYSVSRVEISPEKDVKVLVVLSAWQDRIDNLSVETRIMGMPPVVEELLRQDIAGIEQMFDEMLINLPVAAADWTNGVVKHRLNEFMAQRAPEFRADFDVIVEQNTKVVVDIYPLLPVVRTIDLSMRSDTLPNAALLTQRQDMQDGVNMFVGVPVAFVKRHQATIEQMLAKRVDDNATAKAWSVHTKVKISPGEHTDIMSRSNSDEYFLRFEGRADVGHSRDTAKDYGVMLRGLLGKQFRNRDGIFTLLDFYPQHARWNWDVGYYWDILPNVRGNVRYDLKEKYWKAGMKYDFARKWSFLYEYRHEGNVNELALRYKLHDFLSLECVVDNHDRWLRFIGYF